MGGERYKSKKAAVECRAYMARKRKLGLKIEGLKEKKIKEKYKRKE